jgi:hypothetical protein
MRCVSRLAVRGERPRMKSCDFSRGWEVANDLSEGASNEMWRVEARRPYGTPLLPMG